MNLRPWIWLGLFSVALGVARCSPSQAKESQPPRNVRVSPPKMPAFQFRDLDGKQWGPERFRNRTVVVEFWASWCAPCKELSPDLHAFYGKNRSRLELLSVSVDRDESAFQRYTSRTKPQNPVIYGGLEVVEAWSIKQLPTLILIQNEHILGRWEGKVAIQEALLEISH